MFSTVMVCVYTHFVINSRNAVNVVYQITLPDVNNGILGKLKTFVSV